MCRAGGEAGVQEEPHIRGNSPVLRPHKSPFHTEGCNPPPPLLAFLPQSSSTLKPPFDFLTLSAALFCFISLFQTLLTHALLFSSCWHSIHFLPLTLKRPGQEIKKIFRLFLCLLDLYFSLFLFTLILVRNTFIINPLVCPSTI